MRYLIACLGLLGGCSTATQADCNRAYDKFVELGVPARAEPLASAARESLERSRTVFVDRCVRDLNARDLECVLAATDSATYAACQTP
jgi:hypothetical protein